MKLGFYKTKIPMLRNKLGIHSKLYVRCPVPQFNLYICLPKSIRCFQLYWDRGKELIAESTS